MAVALVYPEPAKGGRGQKSSKIEGFSAGYLSMARAVLRAGDDLAPPVLAGSLSLDVACTEAQRRRQVTPDLCGAPAEEPPI